jgi:hypothetical protein
MIALLLASVVSASASDDYALDLSSVATACAIGLHDPESAAVRQYSEVSKIYDAVTFSAPRKAATKEKKAILLELIHKIGKLLEDAAPKSAMRLDDVEAFKSRLLSDSIYAPRLAALWIEILRGYGTTDADRLSAEMFANTDFVSKWARRVYLVDMACPAGVLSKLAVIDEILSNSSLEVEKEAAIASLSVWEMQIHSEPHLGAALAAIIEKHTDVFLEQRQALGIAIFSRGATFDFAEFQKADKMSYEAFKAVYRDADVAQLVRTMSGSAAYRASAARLVPETAAALKAFGKSRLKLDATILLRLVTRECPETSEESAALKVFATVESFQDVIISPPAHKRWLLDLQELRKYPAHRVAADATIAKLADESLRRENQEILQSVENGLESKLEVIKRLFEGIGDSRFDELVTGLSGDLAIWNCRLLRSQVHNPELLQELWAVIMRYQFGFITIRRRLSLAAFAYQPEKDLQAQIAAFAKSKANISNKPFESLFYTIEEAEAVRKVSMHVSITVALILADITVDKPVLAMIEDAVKM